MSELINPSKKPKKLHEKYDYKYAGLTLEQKITASLYNDPKKTKELFRHVNGNGDDKNLTKNQIYKKLLELERRDIVYRQDKQYPPKPGPSPINSYKWFLESSFIAQNAFNQAKGGEMKKTQHSELFLNDESPQTDSPLLHSWGLGLKSISLIKTLLGELRARDCKTRLTRENVRLLLLHNHNPTLNTFDGFK